MSDLAGMAPPISVWREDDSLVWRWWYWKVSRHGLNFYGATLTRRGAVREARRYLRRKARAEAAGVPMVYTYPGIR